MKKTIFVTALIALFSTGVNLWAHEGHQHNQETSATWASRPLLQRPPYLHVLLNPIPVYGMGLGIVFLLLGLIRSTTNFRTVGLFLILLSGGAAWPVIESGEAAYDQMVDQADAETKAWFKAHHDRGHQAEPVFYVTAAVALAALICARVKPAWANALSALTLVAALLCLRAGAWVARAGGQIRHPEFRAGPP